MTVKNKLKKEIKKDLNINIDDYYPKNDIDAWNIYPKYNFLYNKMFICKIQNIKHAPMPILPEKFPVVIKPIVNLLGMGLNSVKVKSKKEFLQYFDSNHFWCEYFNGEHLSWDLVITNGQIQFICCFKGFKSKNKFGTFNYWKLLKQKNPPDFFDFLVKNYLNDFTGCINLETIKNKIIECHLRMGDIDQLSKDHYRLILYNYINKNENLGDKLNKLPLKKLYLVPIWQELNEYHDLNVIYTYLEKNWEKVIIENENVILYYFDKINHATPGKFKRWFLISTNNFKQIYNLKIKIENDIKEKFL